MPSFFAEVKNPTKKILFYLSNLADHDPVLKIVLNSPELIETNWFNQTGTPLMEKEIRSVPHLKRDESVPYRILRTIHIEMIDEALSAVGEYGEVRLVIEKGQLRFIVVEKSYDVLKWSAGATRTPRQ